MKTLVIVILLLVLLVGMFLSCPSPESFDQYYHDKIAPTESKKFNLKNFFTRDLGLSDYQYKNRYLLAIEEKQGKVVYVGVFNHWFANGSPDQK